MVFSHVSKCVCSQTLTLISPKIPISVWNYLVITDSVVQSTHFFLLIWTLPRFKPAVITSHAVVALLFTILWGIFAGAKGIETKTEEEEEEE